MTAYTPNLPALITALPGEASRAPQTEFTRARQVLFLDNLSVTGSVRSVAAAAAAVNRAVPRRAPRSNGWTAARRRLFCETLAAGGTVSFACARVGLSREAAYKARRRDVGFASQWRRALIEARDAAEHAFLEGLPEHLRVALPHA